jgi:hypothetical protein
MDKQKNETSSMPSQDGGAGRMNETGDNKSNQDNVQHDISSVDRQEGEMNNGETGGNFRDGDQKNKSE